jgi:hypothetical protein
LTNLILSLVTNNDKEGTMLVLHTVFNERMNTRINDLFNHDLEVYVNQKKKKKKKARNYHFKNFGFSARWWLGLQEKAVIPPRIDCIKKVLSFFFFWALLPKERVMNTG